MADEQPKQEKQQQQQSPSSPPSKVPRLSPDEAGVVTTAVPPPPLILGLGLGVGAGSETRKPIFTFMQLQELEHQALIYKYIMAGIPVPLHLVLPIWKSVAASYGPHHYPSFVGLASLCYDYRNSMEPEPGRCRRTDGKKWRCSRDVVPDQKYCERHMHRGRNRSRKPVEAAGAAADNSPPEVVVVIDDVAADATTPAVTTTTVGTTPSSNTELSISIPAANNSGNGNANGNENSNNSESRVGFSPTSVLLQGSNTVKTSAS